jgi:hypothetical protein
MSPAIDGIRIPLPETPVQPSASEGRFTARPPEPSDSAPSRFAALVARVATNIERGERIVAGAASGYASLDPAELIALQAGIYRYSEAIDLTAKLVDRATSAVRTVLSGGH